MAEKNNANCTICGKPYYVCMSCLDAMRLSPWKIHTDTAEHFKVSQVVHGVSTNVYTKEEAKTKLKNINLDDLDTFRPHIKKIIKDILKEDKPVAEAVNKVEEPIKTDGAKAEENVMVEKPIMSRKRSFKIETE
jgi:hypothetical protein